MYKPVIIVPAYSRQESLSRLLFTLNRAKYPCSNIELIISLDKGYEKEVGDVAKKFIFSSGTCSIYCQENHLGLRDHILWCGDLTNKFHSYIALYFLCMSFITM